jgi:hypothetical protein
MLRGVGKGAVALGVTSWLLVPEMSGKYLEWAETVL